MKTAVELDFCGPVCLLTLSVSSRAVAFSGQKSSRNSVGIGKPIVPRRTSFVAPSDPGHTIMAEIPPWLSHVQGFKGAGTPKEALEAVGTIGMGSFWGVCAGAMAKRLSMQLAFAVGMGAIGVKVGRADDMRQCDRSPSYSQP